VDRSTFLPADFSPERKKAVLSRIAKKTFRNSVIYIPKEKLVELITQELKSINYEATMAIEFVKEVETNNGLFVDYSSGVCCFSHLTFH
jgi:hypothetical protein